METKQKTWEECTDYVAKKHAYRDWMQLINKFFAGMTKYPLVTYEQKAAELFNSSTAEERDELKEKLKIAIDSISDLEKEYRKTETELNSYSRIAHQLKEENERLKKHSNKLLEAQSQWQFFAEGYINGSASISEVNHAAIELELASVNLKSLLSKASDGYTKAKD